MALLTDRTLAASSAITASTLIHIVDVNDFSQNPAGSSYKAELGQLTSLFSGGTFTGGSGNCIADFYVTNIHGCSPINIKDSLIMTTGTSITTDNGGVQIDLDAYGVPNSFLISDDNGAFLSRGFYFDNTGIAIFDYNPAIVMDIFSQGDLSIGTKSNNREIYMSTDQGSTKYTGNNPKKGVIISSQNSYFYTGVTNSAIIGGSGLTGTQSDTVYVSKLNIKELGTGTSVNSLGIDIDGNVVSGGTFTGGSGNCIADFYVTNIHSCSPLYINPLSEGNIYVGSANTLTVDLTNETIGVGTTSPTSKLHIVGTGTTSSGYSLKIQDSSNRNILSTRNDNFVFAGDSAVSGYLWSYGLGGQFGFSNENDFPNLYLNSSYLNKFYFSNGAAGSNAFAQINTSNGNWLIGSPNTNVYGAVLTDTKLILQGIDSSSSNYGLKVQNSGGTNNLVVRNDGNVGIGTTSPTSLLHLSTTGLTGSSSSVLRIENKGDGTNYLESSILFNTGLQSNPGFDTSRLYVAWDGIGITDGRFTIQTKKESAYLQFEDVFTVKNKRIGINTNFPNANLHIVNSGPAFNDYSLKVESNSGTNSLVVKSDGNVGIGTSTPTEKLDVSGKTKTTNFQMTSGASPNYVLLSDSSGNAAWSSQSGITGNTDTYVTGFTYTSNTITLSQNNGTSTGVTINTMTGLTINGNLSVTGNTILSATTASTLNLSSVPTTDTDVPAYYLTRDILTGEVKSKIIPGPATYGIYSQTGNSFVVSATTGETSVIDGGIGTLTIPANSFNIGDSFTAQFGGILSSRSADTIRFKVKAGSIILSDSGFQPLLNSTNDVWELKIAFTIRNIGSVGIASIVTLGSFQSTKQTGGGALNGFGFNTINNTTFDTTTSNTLDVTVQFSSDNIQNSIYSDVFVLSKVY